MKGKREEGRSQSIKGRGGEEKRVLKIGRVTKSQEKLIYKEGKSFS